MKYNWKLKIKYVEEYKAGKYIELPHNFRGNRHNFIHMVRDWVKIFDLYGVDGLKNNYKNTLLSADEKPVMNKDDKINKLTKSEKEELIILRKQIEYLKAENAYLKKLRALIVQKQAESSVKAKKQPLSEDSEKKDID